MHPPFPEYHPYLSHTNAVSPTKGGKDDLTDGKIWKQRITPGLGPSYSPWPSTASADNMHSLLLWHVASVGSGFGEEN